MSEPSAVLTQRHGAVLQLTLNAPANRNSLSAPGVLEGLLAGLADLDHDETLRCAVITGAGGAFCSGGDLRQLAHAPEQETRARMTANAALYRGIATANKLVIAAVDGPAFGAGLGLAACCDLVVAGQSARFCCAFVRVGAMPDAALFWSLPARVGRTRARQMMLLADEIDAPEAVAMGLADRMAAGESALPDALALAERLARGPAQAQACIKLGLREAPMGLDEALEFQLTHAPTLFAGDDFREGARAFFEKRAPVFGRPRP
ncbi:enoyl-CoA hydratase-related protein [uncultured Pseudacidovorax sp.]|uniref:enoyl-CoA hydratase/isomerase family protein n=1 Tax=uncultured Pseudacidovorax sp. TaxID=679313 RepID=UPI0025EAA8BB|nr:enoyl-CoA hydratase-related protein [uncultured Pseudacidovorax sp.]